MIETKLNAQLRSFLQANKLYYMQYPLENFPTNRVFIDNTERISGVVIFERQDEMMLYGANEDVLEVIYKEYLDGKEVYLNAVETNTVDFFATKSALSIECICNYAVYDGTPFCGIECNYPTTKVMSKDYNVVVKYHAYGAKRKDVEHYVTSYPNSAIYDGDKLVCWVLSHDNGTMGPLYTLPEYRRKGMAECVMVDLENQILKQNRVPIAFIVEGNTASEHLQAKLHNNFTGRKVCWCKKEK